MTPPLIRLTLGLFCALSPAAAATPDDFTTWDVAIAVYDGVEILDFAGPMEVFQKASGIEVDGVPAFRVFTVAPTHDVITSMQSLRVVPEFSIADAPKPDLLVLPGGRTESVQSNDEFLAWVDATVPGTDHTLSVCTGIFMLAPGGHLDGLDATTYWRLAPAIPSFAPGAVAKTDVRFTDNGQIVTTAGVSAGIDGALHLVARRLGYYIALLVARKMEYDWRPALADVRSYRPYHHEYDAMTCWQLGYALRSLGHMDAATEALENSAARGDARRRQRALYDLAGLHAHMGRTNEACDTLRQALETEGLTRERIESTPDFEGILDHPSFVALLESIESK